MKIPTMPGEDFLDRHRDTNVSRDADQTEFAAIISGSAVVDSGTLDNRISGEIDDELVDDNATRPIWQELDLAIDTSVGRVRQVLIERSQMLGPSYPFEVVGNELVHRQSRSNFYEFCLSICNAPNITTGDYVALPRVFERSTAMLIQGYLGTRSHAIHFGAPRDHDIGTTFTDACIAVNQRTGEWVWDPRQDLPEEINTTGDEGVDFIVWKDCMDDRGGHLFVLGQCACGRQWNSKLNDLNLERLARWLRPIAYVPPVKSFLTPFWLSRGSLKDALDQAGMVFDRPRLVMLAEEMSEAGEFGNWSARASELAGMVTQGRNPL
jgi:hypothetical protein